MASTKIEAFFAKVGARPLCEVCGQNNWSLPNDDAPMTVRLVTETPPLPRPMTGTQFAFARSNALADALYGTQPTAGLLTAFVVACNNCGNVRLHAESIVRKGMSQ